MISRSSTSDTPLIIHLSSISAYSTFGELLHAVRNHHNTTFHDNLSPQKITNAVNPLLKKEKAAEGKEMAKRAYADLESGRRYPRFIELELIFRVLVETFYVEFTDLEITAYVHLAKEKIGQNQKPKEKINETDWDALLEKVFRIHRTKPGRVHLITDAKAQPEPSILTEDPHSRRLQAIEQALRTDTRHLLEREEWGTKMLTYPERDPQVKLVVVQGAIGVGKSYAQALLIQRLVAQSPGYYLIPYLFRPGEGKTPEDYLDEFLAAMLAELTLANVSGETKQQPLTDRIHQVLSAIKSREEKVIFLLDDVQYIFPAAGEWSPSWLEFMETFVREPHSSTLYAMTRTWPGWDERRLAYIESSELLDLSPTASVTLWQSRGFDDVPGGTLREVCIRCGCNPQMMDMLIAQCKKRFFSSNRWDQGTLSSQNGKKSANTRRLEAVLAQDTIFDLKTDVKSREVLQYALTSRLNHQALQMLECLALSPLGLPFSLLVEEFAHAEVALNELASVSALDLNMAASQRATIIPFVREAVLLALIDDGRRNGIESRVTDLYAYWLMELQDFRDDSEQAALIAEMVVRYIRQRQLLKAAELFISFGWLCTLFGHITRIQRVYEEAIREDRGKETETVYEVGRLLLRHRIAVHKGQQIERDERDQIYQGIYKRVVAGEVTLQPHSELEVLHNMLLFYSRKGQPVEASVMFDQTLERLQHTGKMTPEVYALFLFDKGRLMSYRADKEKQLEDSLKFIQASVNCVKDCITNWRLCLKNALPLQEHYVQFKLARALNDLACDLRTLKQYSDAQEAIEESIKLKKKTGTPPYSIATALSECSQILATQGKIREALSINEEAKKMLEESITDGDNMHNPELGLILKERANIFLLQARLTEAKPLLKQAVELMGDKPLRQKDKERAKAQIEEIELIIASSFQPYQLDRRWFSRFSDLVEFNDTQWLTQAGPFTKEERDEWECLSFQEDEQSHDQMLKLIARSRKREFTRSLEGNCEPIIHYPHLPLDDVRNRMNSLTTLHREIEVQEPNMVLRRLYLDAINENLAFLRLCEAVALQDQATTMQCNLQLYGKPSKREFKIALQQLCSMLLEARIHKLASPVALEALTQLKEWGISPQEIVAEDLFIPTFDPIPQQVNHKLLASEKRTFSTTTICQFFQDVLKMYGEDDWDVYVNPARDHTTVDPNIRELILPEKNFSVQKVRQLLAEEIEVHSYRAIAGRNSSLALLGSGLANHLATDEGLAYHYVQNVNCSVYGKYEEKRWNATLTTGFVSGVLTHPLSFPELRNFLEKMFLASELLNDATWEDAFEFSRQAAWRRCSRVFRGAGCVSLKDRVYLQGHLEISDYLAHGGEKQRLYVGCVGVNHLEDMAELGILAPNYPHQHLALTTDLAERLTSYEK